MKKTLCVLLTLAVLMSVCAPMAFAIKEEPVKLDGPETVIFATDFENDTVGKVPSNFSGSLVTDVACMYVAEDDGNRVVKTWHGNPNGPDEKARGPRVEKNFSIQGLQLFYVDMDVKTSGGETTLAVNLIGEESKQRLGSITVTRQVTEWSHVRIAVDLKNGTATAYMNDEEFKSIELAAHTERKVVLQLMASAAPEESWAMFDNLKISTTQVGYDPNPGIRIEDIDAPYKEADAKEETGDLLTIIAEDFEGQTVDKIYVYDTVGQGFQIGAITEVASIRIKESDGNKYAVAIHGDPKAEGATARAPRMAKAFFASGIKTMVADMDVMTTASGKTQMQLRIVNKADSKIVSRVNLPTDFKKWTHVKVRYDFEAKTAKVYTGGKLYKEYTADLAGANNIEFQVYSEVDTDGSWCAIDNFKLTTPDKDIGGMIRLDNTVDFSKVKLPEEEKTGMLDVMKMSHPRLFTNDWQAIRDKVAADDTCKIWQANIIQTCAGILTMPVTKYEFGETGTINSASTTAKNNMILLSAAYNLTGDVRYKDRLYKELAHVATWPDWGAKEYLCTAHLILGYAVAYDWLYHDWTETERTNIREWLMQKGMTEAVLGYEGFLKGTNWVNRVSNWTNVCNGSNMIAAIAIADTYPDVAEYIFKKGKEGLEHAFVEISADGAYAETLSYWDYGIRHQVKVMAALEACLKEGASLPAELDFTNIRGLDKTADYPIYYNGAAAGFNFGDSDDYFSNSPILYWLASKYNKPHYTWYSLNLINNNAKVKQPTDRSAVWSILWYDPTHLETADTSFSMDKFYQTTEPDGANGLSMRSSWVDQGAMSVMAHAGDSRTGHLHHDAGGFVLDWAGKRWVHMYGRTPGGVMSYSWSGYHNRTHPNGHFQYYHGRAEGNNTIIANPQQGAADMKVDYYAPMERFDSASNTAFGIIDMTDTNADYVSAKRGFMLTDMRQTLIIQDEIVASKPSEFYWFANTKASVTLASDGKSALLEMDDDKMLVRITQGPASAKLGIMPAQPLPTSPNPSAQATALEKMNEEKLFIHVENETTLNLTVEFTPLREDEGIPPAQPVIALDSWSAEGSPALITSQSAGDIVALKVDNPNAYAKGAKTYVDTANLDIKPIVQNGRTLVPVRFIAEKFGATVGWEDATQTVSVKSGVKKITLQIGSNQMDVDGNVVTLDVPAQTIGGRTLIPLRALVEALGKQVFWDDRGLIIISDFPVTFDAETITKLIDLLDIRVQVDGKELRFFDSEVYDYYYTAEQGRVPVVTASATAGATVVQGNPAQVLVGGKTYNIHFTENHFLGVAGGLDAIRKLVLSADNGPKPTQRNYLPIQSATSSILFSDDKYPMNGTYDNVINETDTLNRWSANGAGNWIAYDLGEVKNLHAISIAGFLASSRSYTFEIAVSNDGESWTVVNPGAKTTLGVDMDVFKLGDVQARYVKLTGLEATGTTWMGIAEVRLYDSAAMAAADAETWCAEFHSEEVYGWAGGTPRKLIVKGVNGRGQTVDVDLTGYTVTSEDPSIATVDAQGNVTFVGRGRTKLTVSGSFGGVNRTYSVTAVGM